MTRQVRPEMAPILLIYVMLVSSKSMYILDTSVSRIYLVWAEIDDYFIGFYLCQGNSSCSHNLRVNQLAHFVGFHEI